MKYTFKTGRKERVSRLALRPAGYAKYGYYLYGWFDTGRETPRIVARNRRELVQMVQVSKWVRYIEKMNASVVPGFPLYCPPQAMSKAQRNQWRTLHILSLARLKAKAEQEGFDPLKHQFVETMDFLNKHYDAIIISEQNT